MTRDHDLKRLIRARMSATGQNYTAARAALMAQRATDPSALVSAPAAPRAAADAVDAEPAIDPVRARAEHERLLRPFWREGRITSIPARRRARFALLLELLARFAPGEEYSEAEVGEILGVLHPDIAFWRRELVDYALLERDASGARYRVAARVPNRTGNMAQEVTDWERIWLPRFLGGETRG